VLSSPRLPELPPEVDRRLRDGLGRVDGARLAAIQAEVERTLVEEDDTRSRRARGQTTAPSSLEVGRTIVVPRRVRDGAGVRQLHERFEIREQLSSPNNISGDVFRATRYWDDRLYGDVVLKTPKAELRDTIPEDTTFDYRSEMRRELRNLSRFDGQRGILAASGRPFVWGAELVIQMKYQPWAFHEYLKYFRDEVWLTAALCSLASQCLAAIDLMARTRDDEGPRGFAHVDLKSTHLRLDYHESSHPEREGEWVVTMIDLDSVLPVGPTDYHGAKYNRGCVDPEKFMCLDDPGTLVSVDPSETVYAMGLTFLSAVALLLGSGLERRGFRPVGLGQGASGAVLEDGWALREEIERTRAVDRQNFLRVYHLNRMRRLQAGLDCTDPAELVELVQGEPTLGPIFGGESECTVEPRFFVGIHECLRRRSARLGARELQTLFKGLVPAHREG
jgi:hypothetical protein